MSQKLSDFYVYQLQEIPTQTTNYLRKFLNSQATAQTGNQLDK